MGLATAQFHTNRRNMTSYNASSMNTSLEWIDDASAAWDRRGLTRRLVALDSPGLAGARDLPPGWANFGSNDYLGLAADPRVVSAVEDAARIHGWGAGASALVTGWSAEHQELAGALAAFEQAEAVAIFPSGFAANLGAIAAVVESGDAVYADRLSHACLIDGARLSAAKLRVYPHNDHGRLEQILHRDRGRFRRSLIVTEGVFSMDGDSAPLADLADLADEFGAMLLVDEAHGTGVVGPDGRGAAAEAGVADRVHIRVGTLSKALGSIGGFVAGTQKLIDWLVNHARTLIYSTSLPPAAAAAARCALAISRDEPWRRERVCQLGDRVRHALVAGGFQVPQSRGPIVPVLLGDAATAVAMADRLRERGVLVPAIRPPTVPAGTARLRISLSAGHSDGQVELLVGGVLGDRRKKRRKTKGKRQNGK